MNKKIKGEEWGKGEKKIKRKRKNRGCMLV